MAASGGAQRACHGSRGSCNRGRCGGPATEDVPLAPMSSAPSTSCSRVVQVSSRLAGRVDVWRWYEFGSSVGGELDFPVAVVDQPMMVPAQGDGVVQIGWAAVDPRHDVMYIRPAWRPIASGEGAAAVAGQDGLACGAGVGAAAAADV